MEKILCAETVKQGGGSSLEKEKVSVTLEEHANRIRHLQANVQRGIIEIGRELIAAKNEIGHGGWSEWLSSEFDWSDRTARYFMAIAERFGNRNTYSDLKASTLKAMLALPKGDEQAFIEAQAKAGNPVENQTARQVQSSVKKWNQQKALFSFEGKKSPITYCTGKVVHPCRVYRSGAASFGKH